MEKMKKTSPKMFLRNILFFNSSSFGYFMYFYDNLNVRLLVDKNNNK